MFKSPNLDLSYVAPSQAQKHVTVNESFRRLDALTQLTVRSSTRTNQPTDPVDGDIYILPSGKTGAAWGTMADHSLAAYQDGAWVQFVPKEGWRAYILDESQLRIFDGAWDPLAGTDPRPGGGTGGDTGAGSSHSRLTGLDQDDHPHYLTPARGDSRYPLLSNTGSAAARSVGTNAGDLVQLEADGKLPPIDGSQLTNLPSSGSSQFAPQFGINATADSVNKLSVNSAAVLFNNIGDGTQIKVNKANERSNGSFLFQNNFSARAEVGLTGDDDFHFKVSPDGASFKEAIVLDKNTGRANFPNTPSFAIHQSGRFYLYTDNRWVTNSDDKYGFGTENMSESGGVGTYPNIEWEHLGYYLPKATKIHRINFLGKANSSEVTDLELFFFARLPKSQSLWQDGFDNDDAHTVVNIYRDLFVHPAGGDPDFPGNNMIPMRKRTIDLDFTMPDDGYFSVFLRPVGTLSANRFAYAQIMAECSLG